MFNVTADIKRRVAEKVQECVNIINTKHSVKMPAITVVYDINSSRIGGQAVLSENKVRVNPVFLNAYTDHYINSTIPHEVAHLGVNFVHRRLNRVHGVSAHGYEWESMMRVLGVVAARCHSYEVPVGISVGRQKAKYNYKCSRCGEVLTVGPKRHARMHAGAHMWHGNCGKSSRLVFEASVGKVSYSQAKAAATPVQLAPSVIPTKSLPVQCPAPAKKAGTKFEQCYGWFKYFRTSSCDNLRQTCIAAFIKEVGMSQAGASTYYNECKKTYAQE